MTTNNIQSINIPTFSSKSIGLYNQHLRKSESETKFPAQELIYKGTESVSFDLKYRAESLEKAVKELENAKDHKIRDRIFCLLRSALLVTVIAAGVIGTLALIGISPVGAVLVPIAAWLIASFLGAYYGFRVNEDIVKNLEYLAPIILPIIGPFLPLIEAFRKIKGLEKDLEQKETDYEEYYKEMSDWFENNVTGEKVMDQLLFKLTENQEKIEKNLNLQRFSPHHTTGVIDLLEADLQNHKKALDELLDGRIFFSIEAS